MAVLATIGVQAQTEITSKCGCKSETTYLEKWDFTRTDSTETLDNPDLNDWIVINWVESTIRIKGQAKPYTIKYHVSATEPEAKVWFADKLLTLFYDNKGHYTGHQITNL